MAFIRNRNKKLSSQRKRRFMARSPQRRHRLSTAVICVFLYLCVLCSTLQVSMSHSSSLRGLEEKKEEAETSSNDSSDEVEVRCFESNDCTLCPPTGNRDSCEATERRQRFHCHVNAEEGTLQNHRCLDFYAALKFRLSATIF